jgi:hypothetical protein
VAGDRGPLGLIVVLDEVANTYRTAVINVPADLPPGAVIVPNPEPDANPDAWGLGAPVLVAVVARSGPCRDGEQRCDLHSCAPLTWA